MKRRWLIFIALAAMLVVFISINLRPADKRYRGKSIEAWAILAYSGNSEAIAAIKEAGTNSISELLKQLQSQDSGLSKALWTIRGRLPAGFRKRVGLETEIPQAITLRGAATRALGIIGPEARPAVPLLAKTFRTDPAYQIRWETASALAKIGASAVPLVAEALADTDPHMRKTAATTLAEIGPEAGSTVPELIRRLKDSDQGVRAAAAHALACIGAPGLPALVEVLEHGTSDARIAAAQEVLRYYQAGGRTAKALITMATTDASADARVQAIEALAIIRPHGGVMQVFVQGLEDQDAAVRAAAAKALGESNRRTEVAVGALIKSLKDESPLVREVSVRALGRLGAAATNAQPEVARLENDAEEAVRIAAKEAIRNITKPE